MRLVAGEIAAMFARDSAGDGKAESAPERSWIEADEPLEDALALLVGDAGTIVGDACGDLSLGLPEPDIDMARRRGSA